MHVMPFRALVGAKKAWMMVGEKRLRDLWSWASRITSVTINKPI